MQLDGQFAPLPAALEFPDWLLVDINEAHIP